MKLPSLDYARMNPRIAYLFFLGFGALFGFWVAIWQNGIGWAIIMVGIMGFLWYAAGYIFWKAHKAHDPVIKKEKPE